MRFATLEVNGRQFVLAIVAGGRGEGAELVALSIPQPNAGGGRAGRGAAAPQEQL